MGEQISKVNGVVSNLISDSRFIKIQLLIIIICFIIYEIGVVSAWLNPVMGYELNVYTSTPAIFWFAIIVCMIVGSLAYVTQYNGSTRLSRFVKYSGLCLLIFSSIALASIPFIRGYFGIHLSGDAGTHLSQLMLTVINGAVPNTIYPGCYGGLAMLSQISSTTPYDIIYYFPTYNMFLFVLYSILVCRLILGNSKYSAFICLFLPFGSGLNVSSDFKPFMPMTITNTFLVLMILVVGFLILRDNTNKKPLIIVLVISSIVIPFLHPLPLFEYMALLVTVGIVILFNKPVRKRLCIPLSICGIISIISFLFWSQQYKLNRVSNSVINLLMSEGKISSEWSLNIIDTASAGISYGYGLWDYVSMVLIPFSLYALIPIAILMYLIITLKKRSSRNLFYESLMIYIVFICILTIAIFIVERLDPSRFFSMLCLVGFISFGYIFKNIPKILKNNWKQVRGILLIICVIFFAVSSVFMYYGSPYSNMTPQTNLPEGYYFGAETTLSALNENYDVISQNLAIHRFHEIFYPYKSRIHALENIKYHFGYDKGSTYSNVLEKNTYLYIAHLLRIYYVEFRHQLAPYRYTTTDFEQLELDDNVNKIYENKELDLYLVLV